MNHLFVFLAMGTDTSIRFNIRETTHDRALEAARLWVFDNADCSKQWLIELVEFHDMEEATERRILMPDTTPRGVSY